MVPAKERRAKYREPATNGAGVRHLAGERVDRAYAARRRYELSPLDQLGSLGALGEVTILDRDSHQAALEREAAARFDRDGPATAYVAGRVVAKSQ